MRDMREATGDGAREVAVNRVTVTIFGEEYALRGDAKPAYMERLAEMVDRRMHEIAKRQPRLGITRIAVLTAINLADELSKLEEQYQRVLSMLEKEWDRRKRELNGQWHGPVGGPAPGAQPAAGGPPAPGAGIPPAGGPPAAAPAYGAPKPAPPGDSPGDGGSRWPSDAPAASDGRPPAVGGDAR